MIYLAWVTLAISLLPALMVLRNLRLFRPPAERLKGPLPQTAARTKVSVLIPARDEAASIRHSVDAALHSQGVEVEVVVLDDASTDATADIVSAIAGRDTRVRLVHGRDLPAPWNGKQFACWQLATAAQYPLLVFLDADVRVAEQAIARLAAERQHTGAALLLGAFPHQETETFWERLLIPLMHFILLGFLPIGRMRRTTEPSLAAGCGQLFLTDRGSYDRADGHASIRQSRHDGIMLPRAYRRAGMSTDVCDGTDIARCRMYHDAGEVFRGLLKNATEGMARPPQIVIFSILLLGGSVVPWIALPCAMVLESGAWTIAVLAAALVIGWSPRWICAVRFSQSKEGALLHPLAVTVFVALQWIAFGNALRGKRVAWRGRIAS